MPYKDVVMQAYACHKSDAKRRGIPFLLTYEEWYMIWMESGKWEQRGWRRGQYVMARPGDEGAYELSNVVICLAEENRAERNRNYVNVKPGFNPWDYFKNPDEAKRKKRESMVVISARRERNARGEFISTKE